MPSYQVIGKGFFEGKLYTPYGDGKRNVLHTDKPFDKPGTKNGKNPMPKWLKEMPKESAALKKKRKAAEKAQAALEAAEAAEQKRMIAAASTEGDGAEASFIDKVEGDSDTAVETL